MQRFRIKWLNTIIMFDMLSFFGAQIRINLNKTKQIHFFFSYQILFINLLKIGVLTAPERPMRGTLFDVFKKKFSKSLKEFCDRRPKRGIFLLTFKKNPGVSVLAVFALHMQQFKNVKTKQTEIK